MSTPATPLRRRAAVLPVSVALHAGAVALALLVPVLRPGALPEASSPLPVWEAIARPPEPPRVRTEAPPRVATITPRRSSEQVVPEVAPPAAAAGPAATVIEPDFLPVGDPPAPCFLNCDGAAATGSGDGPSAPSSDTVEDGTGTGTGPVRPGGNIQQPQRTVYVEPVFPAIAVAARVSAVVVLECIIDPTGQVTGVRVVTGHPLLDAAALTAVRQWRYTPTRLNGVPVPVLLTVTVRFQARR